MQFIKIFLCFFLLNNLCFAQGDSLAVQYDDSEITIQKISENDLSQYKKDKDFNYVETTEEETFVPKIILWLKNILTQFFEAIFGLGNAKGIVWFLLYVLPYLLLGVLVFLLIKFFLKVNSKNLISGKQKSATVIFSEDENIIKNEDIQNLINNAIQQQNYRLAIRYSYLMILKQLSEKQLIYWEPQKTNDDYIKEIAPETIKDNFKSITRIYDYVWYGEFAIDAFKFEALKPQFTNLTNALNTD